MSVFFEKWEGLGNHFVVLESLPEDTTVQELCDARRGVGADGVLLLDRSPPSMTIFNADGSRAAMCGNGLRCAARWFAERGVGLGGGIATDSGTLRVGEVGEGVAVEVGRAQRVGAGQFMGFRYVSVDIGNPHAVFLDPAASFDLESVGAAMQTHPDFPDGVNVHEVRSGASALIVVPFERGVGLDPSVRDRGSSERLCRASGARAPLADDDRATRRFALVRAWRRRRAVDARPRSKGLYGDVVTLGAAFKPSFSGSFLL